MTRPTPAEEEAARAAAEVARRAIRRLDVLEWVIFAGALGIAILGGAAVSWMIVQATEWPFRATWITTSLLLFVVPGGVTILRMRRDERAAASRATEHRKDDDG